MTAPKNSGHSLYYIIDHFVGKAGINADEERITHDDVGLFEGPVNAVLDIGEARLAQNVAAEDEPGFDVRSFQLLNHRTPVDSLPYRYRKTERGRIGAWVDF